MRPLWLLLAVVPAALEAQTGIRDLVAEFDRLAARPLWPGFVPARTPLAISDGDSTWLIRHPAPPAEFVPVAGWPNASVSAGLYPAVRANTHAEIGGTMSATLLLSGRRRPPRGWTRIAGTLIHEAFHVYQSRYHPGWFGNEGVFFTYPVLDTAVQRLQRLETESWRRATLGRARVLCWAKQALRLRHERFARLTPDAVAYERGNELNEGLATWVETKATRAPAESLVPREGFPPVGVRLRAYAVGPVLPYLLDRYAPGWPARLNADTTATLDQLLAGALPSSRCLVGFSDVEQDSVAALANRDAQAVVSSRDSARREFFDRPGWSIVIEALPDAPLWPQGFDPWNVIPLDQKATLHRRWMKLGNEAGFIEALNRSVVTFSAGQHPLFNGVARMVVAGLDSLPSITQDSGATRIDGVGLSGRLQNARADTVGQVITVHLLKNP